GGSPPGAQGRRRGLRQSRHPPHPGPGQEHRPLRPAQSGGESGGGGSPPGAQRRRPGLRESRHPPRPGPGHEHPPQPPVHSARASPPPAADHAPSDRAQPAPPLPQALAKTTNSIAPGYLARGLAAVAPRLEPKDAATTLAQAMARTTDPDAQSRLAQGLGAVLM